MLGQGLNVLRVELQLGLKALQHGLGVAIEQYLAHHAARAALKRGIGQFGARDLAQDLGQEFEQWPHMLLDFFVKHASVGSCCACAMSLPWQAGAPSENRRRKNERTKA